MTSDENVPIVSICLITFNHINFIKKAIDGVFIQTTNFKWELIVADDFSTDGTRDILLAYNAKYPELIKLIFQKKNVGPARNWLDLINAPVGKYIAYFEGDDYWKDPNKLQKQVDFLEEHPDYIACCGNAVYVNDGIENEKVRNWDKSKDITTKDFLYGNDIVTGTVLFRNQLSPRFFKLLEKAYAGDWMLFYYLSKNGKFYFTPEVLSAYRIHSDGAWNKLDLIQKLNRERSMKIIILKDNLLNRNSFVLLREIAKINGTLFNIRSRKIIKSILGERMVERARKLKGL